MKILQVCAIDVSVETLLKPLIQALLKQQYTVHIACADTGLFQSLRDEGFNMINIPIDRNIRPISNLKSVYQLYSLMKREKYDIVHVHTPVAAALGRIAAKLAGIRTIVYTAHGFYFHEGMPKSQYRLFYNTEKFLAKYFTDMLLLQSREDYELCLQRSFNKPDRIRHIGNGVDIETKFNPEKILVQKEQLRQQLGIRKDDIVICFIGRLVKEKGVFELLESFNLIEEKYANVRLLLIGSLLESERDQGSYEKLKIMLNHPKIIAPGFRRDIPALLEVSNIFVLPSYREGMPRSIIEAMAMGKPVIATDIRGCREEVADGENGFLVEKQNSLQLAEKLSLLIENQELRRQMGLNGRKRVEQEFDEAKVIGTQLQIFNMIKGKTRN